MSKALHDKIMNRNVSIVVVILVLVVIAGYLVWLRSKYQPTVSPAVTEVEVTPSPSPEVSASPSAAVEATGSVKPNTATSSPTRR